MQGLGFNSLAALIFSLLNSNVMSKNKSTVFIKGPLKVNCL